jgi:DNA-directed RNA polymerase specialized sigma24 family protein
MKIIITKQLLDKFITEGCLSKEEAFIMRTRIEGWSRQEQAAALNTSLSSIDRRIRRLKKVYDEVQKNNPEFPSRLEK